MGNLTGKAYTFEDSSSYYEDNPDIIRLPKFIKLMKVKVKEWQLLLKTLEKEDVSEQQQERLHNLMIESEILLNEFNTKGISFEPTDEQLTRAPKSRTERISQTSQDALVTNQSSELNGRYMSHDVQAAKPPSKSVFVVPEIGVNESKEPENTENGREVIMAHVISPTDGAVMNGTNNDDDVNLQTTTISIISGNISQEHDKPGMEPVEQSLETHEKVEKSVVRFENTSKQGETINSEATNILEHEVEQDEDDTEDGTDNGVDNVVETLDMSDDSDDQTELEIKQELSENALLTDKTENESTTLKHYDKDYVSVSNTDVQ